MDFIPEEFRQMILIKINKLECKLSNCNINDFIEAFNTYYNLVFMGFDLYITLSFGQKLMKCEWQHSNEEEKMKAEELKSIIAVTIIDLENKVEKDKRRILN